MQNPHPMTLYKTVPVTEDNIPEGEVLAISKNGNRLLAAVPSPVIGAVNIRKGNQLSVAT
mgnify:CR=1 FL=1